VLVSTEDRKATDKLLPLRMGEMAVPEPWEGITSPTGSTGTHTGRLERTGCRASTPLSIRRNGTISIERGNNQPCGSLRENLGQRLNHCSTNAGHRKLSSGKVSFIAWTGAAFSMEFYYVTHRGCADLRGANPSTFHANGRDWW